MLSRKKRKLLSYQLGFQFITDPKETMSVCAAFNERHKRYAAEWRRGVDAVPLIRSNRKIKEHIDAVTNRPHTMD